MVTICGIVGLWHRERALSTNDLSGMLGAIFHRGPDEEGRFCERNFAMGMRRLSVIDVKHGQQPYVSENDQVVAIYNGELYNYPELKQLVESRGHKLNSRADGEVLVHLYEEFGAAFVEKLRGMFAIAVWDRTRGQILLARDHVGQKPLYLWEGPNQVAFASEIKAFFHLEGFQADIDGKWLPAYLAHRFVPAPHTLLKNVTKLRPGEAMIIHQNGRRQRWMYWEPVISEPDSAPSMSHWVDRLDALLTDTVERHLSSDVPLGLFLSGGLDSSVLAALATKTSNMPIEAWSASFPENYPGYDEFHWAQKVADTFKMPLHRVEVDMTITPERVQELAYILDEPMADPTVLPLDGLARFAAEQETVMLSGEGADEIFAGYAGYGEVASLKNIRKIPPNMRQMWINRGLPGSGAMMRAGSSIADRYRGVGFTFNEEEQQRILVERVTGDRPAAVREYWESHRSISELQSMQGFDVKWFLPDDVLLKADRIGMHYNLEIRVPYCDFEVVQMALNIPLALRRRAKSDKLVLRKLAQRHLPKSVVDRPKRGFPTPLTSLLSGPLHDIAWDTLTGSTAAGRGWFHQDEVKRLLETMGPDNGTASRQVYSLLMLELWVKEMVERGRAHTMPQRRWRAQAPSV